MKKYSELLKELKESINEKLINKVKKVGKIDLVKLNLDTSTIWSGKIG